MNKADWVVIIKKERKEALQVRPTLSNVFFGGTQHIAVAKQEVTIKETTKVTQRMQKPTMKPTKIVFVLRTFVRHVFSRLRISSHFAPYYRYREH